MNRSKSYTKVYSRFGKTCDEKFTNVKAHRKEIFFGEKQKLHYKKPENQRQDQSKPDQILDILNSIESYKSKSKHKVIKKKLSPVFRSQGRDEYYQSTV